MSIGSWAFARQRSILFVLAIAILAGLFAGLNLPVALFPQIDFPRVSVTLEAGEMPADQTVATVTRPVELAVRAVPGLTTLRSTTSRGSTELSVNFAWGTDMTAATLQVESAVNATLSSLPAGVHFEVRRMDPTVFPVLAYSLTSDTLDIATLQQIATYQLAPRLAAISGVASAKALGNAVREYAVTVDPARLAALGIQPEEVAGAISAANIVTSVGRVDDRHKMLLTLTRPDIVTPENIAAIVIKASPTAAVRVGDVADVSESVEPLNILVTADGKPAVLIDVYQQRDGNTVQIAAAVKAELDAAAGSLPPGVNIQTWYDQSELIVNAAGSVRDAVIIGVALAALVLLVFLRSFKVMLIALVVVPATLSIVTLLLLVLGLSFNIMTLGGMAAAIGLVVDDAIVMVEQIFRRLSAAADERAQVVAAADEFLRPLAGSSAVTTIIFVPLAFLGGVTGAFFKALSLTMASGLIVSFLIAWLVLPILAARLVSRKDAERQEARGHGGASRYYGRALAWSLKRPAVVFLCTLLFVGGGALAYLRIGTGFMPRMDEGGFVLDYLAPPGTALADSDAMLKQVEAVLRSTPDVLTWSRRTGTGLGGGLSEANNGDFFVRLKPFPRRPIGQVMEEVRTRVEAEVPGLQVELILLMEDLIGDLTAVPQPVEVKLFGPDLAALSALAPKVADLASGVSGIIEVQDGIVVAGDALNIKIDPVHAAIEGLTPQMVTAQLQLLVAGQIATTVQNGDQPIAVRVAADPAVRNSTETLRALELSAPDSRRVPLERIAEVTIETGQAELTRENMKPMVAVTGRVEGRDVGSAVAELKAKLDASGLMTNGTYFEIGGLYAEQAKAQHELLVILAAAIALVFFVLLVLYERFAVAVAVIATPLLALAAIFIGLFVTGLELDISAMMGMTMVVGIVTEVAIFYTSEMERLLQAGLTLPEALAEAGMTRLRPIAMTTIAAALALLPLALAIGQGAEMQQPLAVAIIAGLIAQMPLVLFLMPVLLSLTMRRAAESKGAMPTNGERPSGLPGALPT